MDDVDTGLRVGGIDGLTKRAFGRIADSVAGIRSRVHDDGCRRDARSGLSK